MINTLEGINSRTNEAEEVEDRVVEITAMEQNKERRMKKKSGEFKRPLGQRQMHQVSHYRGPRRRREGRA